MTTKKKTTTKKKIIKKRSGATSAKPKGVDTLGVVHIYPELKPWLTKMAEETNRPKREVVNLALEFAIKTGFALEPVIPGSVQKWLEKTGRALA